MGYRIIIPDKLRENLLRELLVGHLETATSYVWWPTLFNDVEQSAKSCAG